MDDEEFRTEVLSLLGVIANELAAICKRLGGIHEEREAQPEDDGKPLAL